MNFINKKFIQYGIISMNTDIINEEVVLSAFCGAAAKRDEEYHVRFAFMIS